MVSFCFCLFGEFAKVFDRVAHLHSGARAFALSGPSNRAEKRKRLRHSPANGNVGSGARRFTMAAIRG